jgi:hypothetical protein
MRAKKCLEVKNVGGFALEGNLDGLVLFAKVGWMKFYNGSRPDDLKPIGGGLNNRTNFGHEGFNFRSHENRLLGFVSAPARGGKLDLQRIDPSPVARNRIRSATVIFIATEPRVGGQRIVGWYRNATIHALRIPYSSAIRASMTGEVRPSFPRFKPSGYQFEGDLADATLLPLTQRRLQRVSIPKKHGIGEANVCYPFDRHGKANPQKLKWVRKALEYVGSYSGPNLLSEDGLEDELENAVSVVRDSGAGFQSDPRIRKEIEEYAMECARKYLIRRRYKEIMRTDDRHCYDFTCLENGKTIYVEVKGSQAGGEKVIITKNEKAHLESHPNAILYVRHSVDVSVGRRIRVSGGTERVLNRWDARSGSFAAAAYIYTLPVRE